MKNENSKEKTEDDTRETEGKQTKEESGGEMIRDSENKGTATSKASAPSPLTSTEADILEQFAGVCIFLAPQSAPWIASNGEGGDEGRWGKFASY